MHRLFPWMRGRLINRGPLTCVAAEGPNLRHRYRDYAGIACGLFWSCFECQGRLWGLCRDHNSYGYASSLSGYGALCRDHIRPLMVITGETQRPLSSCRACECPWPHAHGHAFLAPARHAWRPCGWRLRGAA